MQTSIGTYPGRSRRPATTHRRHWRHNKLVIAIVLVAVGVYSFLQFGTGHAASAVSLAAIRSGLSGYCLDNSHSKLTAGNPLDIWHCNNTAAQDWSVAGATIKQADNWCM